MPSSHTSWYFDPDQLVGELRRAGGGAVELPRIAGLDDFREIRRGGQGIVFSATQRSTRRRVAVKVVLDGAFASETGRRRFEREIDLIAGLRHPNIVNILDSGVTGDGRLYFVMEFIDGVPLDQFVAEALAAQTRCGPLKNLLILFAKVCDAVNHAHQQGVIHRDLKPGNILVDSAGEPHVCDFGLAKTEADGAQDDGASLVVSVTGQFMGSLPWASPEQVEGQSKNVDVRSDVYSLGVILYQILTGKFPYDVAGGIRNTFENILHVEPSRPSTIVAKLNDEIDTIVLKCLAKDPQRRYQSAGELLRDIQHFLAGEPIEAKRDSAWYTLRKTLRRYQYFAGAAIIVLAVVMAGLGISLWSWRNAARARDEARKETEQRSAIGGFLERMLTSVDPGRDGREVRFMEVVDRAAAEIGLTIREQPVVEAQIRRTLGSTYSALGMFEQAERHIQAAYDLSEKSLGPLHRTTLELLVELPKIAQVRGRMEEAESKARTSLETVRSALGEDDRLTLNMTQRLGEIVSTRGNTEEGERLLRAAMARQRQVLGDRHPDTSNSMNALAVLLKQSGRLKEAEALYREALQAGIAAAGSRDPGNLTTMSNLALDLQSQGRLDESEAMQQEVLESRLEVLGEEHPETLNSMSNLATLLIERRRFHEAEKLLRRAVNIQNRTIGPDHPWTLTAMNNLAKVLHDLGRFDEAEKMFRDALEGRRRIMGPQHAQTLLTSANLAALLSAVGRVEDAVGLHRHVLDARKRTLGDDHLETMVSKNNLALLLQKEQNLLEAEKLLNEICRSAAKVFPPEHYINGLFLGNYGRCLMALNRTSEAEEHFVRACRILIPAFGANDPRSQQNIRSLAELYENSGRPDKAGEWRAKLATTQPAAAATRPATARPASMSSN